MPVHPRLARLAVEACRRGYRSDGCSVAALLNERSGPRGPAATGPSERDRSARSEGFARNPRHQQALTQLLRLAPPPGPREGTRDDAIQIAVLADFRSGRPPPRSRCPARLRGAAQLSADSAVREAELLVAVDAEERRDGGARA